MLIISDSQRIIPFLFKNLPSEIECFRLCGRRCRSCLLWHIISSIANIVSDNQHSVNLMHCFLKSPFLDQLWALHAPALYTVRYTSGTLVDTAPGSFVATSSVTRGSRPRYSYVPSVCRMHTRFLSSGTDMSSRWRSHAIVVPSLEVGAQYYHATWLADYIVRSSSSFKLFC